MIARGGSSSSKKRRPEEPFSGVPPSSNSNNKRKKSLECRRVLLLKKAERAEERRRQRSRASCTRVYEVRTQGSTFEVWQGFAGEKLKYQRSRLKSANSILESTIARKVQREGFHVKSAYRGEPKNLVDAVAEDVLRLVFTYLTLSTLGTVRCTTKKFDQLCANSCHCIPAYRALQLRGINQITGALLSSWAPEIRELCLTLEFTMMAPEDREQVFELVAGCASLQRLDLTCCGFPPPQTYAGVDDTGSFMSLSLIRSKLESWVRELHFPSTLDDECDGELSSVEQTPFHCKLCAPPEIDHRTKFPPQECLGVTYASVLPSAARITSPFVQASAALEVGSPIVAG